MKPIQAFRSILAWAICSALAVSAHAENRTWTSANGQNTFDGELIAYDSASGTVKVKRTDGRDITFKQNFLSAADIGFLKARGDVAEPEETTTPAAAASSPAVTIHATPGPLPRPDGKDADMSKPVQVFIIMGQSNTLEMGKVTDGLKGLYPFLASEDGAWSVRKDVRNVSVMEKNGPNLYRNDWLTISGNKIGIEIGIGHHLGNAIDAPVMVLKSSIGNRSLGWDLLPPSIKSYEYAGQPQPGYKQIFKSKDDLTVVDWTGEGWYAGKQWDDDTRNALNILKDLGTYYPGATKYEVAGFLWWQGDKDMRNPAHFNNYEKHLVALINDLRKTFDTPKAAFVTASLGQTAEGDTTSGHGVIMQAMKNVASGKYSSELGNNIGFVYTHPLSKGGSSSSHYSGNAETYMNVGLGMGEEMVKQLKGK